jgi:hypothetical protein
MPLNILDRRHRTVIAAGYACGIGAVPWLPGPYWSSEHSFVVRAGLALLMPTAALVTCLAADILFRRTHSAAQHSASVRAVSSVMFYAALFMVSLHGLILVSLLGFPIVRFAPHRLVVVLAGLLLIGVGNLLPRIRPNLVLGVHTRRLLANPMAWARMHRLVGYCLVALGGLTVSAGVALSKYQIPALLGAAVVVAATVNLTAYWRWTRDW